MKRSNQPIDLVVYNLVDCFNSQFFCTLNPIKTISVQLINQCMSLSYGIWWYIQSPDNKFH